MKKIDSTVLKETEYIAFFTLILSVILQSVFLILNKWDYTVLLGNIFGFLAAVGNFFLMGITVQKALTKDQKEAKDLMKLSQTLRMLMLFVAAIIGYLVPFFNIIAVIIPFLFPRIAISLRPLIKR